MALRDTLKLFIPKFLWEELHHPQGYVIDYEEYNERWNLTREAADHTTKTLHDTLDMLYETILSDTDASVHIKLNVIGIAADNLNAALTELNNEIESIVINAPAEAVIPEDVSVYRLNKDVNNIFPEIQYKRPDGTLAIKSVLSDGTSPQYLHRTVTYYGPDGITVLKIVFYTLNYVDGDFINEVIQ